MLAYSSHRPVAGSRGSSPHSMLVIAALHVGAVAILVSAKMEMPSKIVEPPFRIDTIKLAPPPEARPVEQPKVRQPAPRSETRPSRSDPVVPLPMDPTAGAQPDPQPFPPLPSPADPLPGTGNGGPSTTAKPIPATPALLLTGPSELRPPYPDSKRASGEEADLKLRLTVDPKGRVIAVEPLGRADRAFLQAARRHILAHWRYRPATSAGEGVVSTLVITLRFRLDD